MESRLRQSSDKLPGIVQSAGERSAELPRGGQYRIGAVRVIAHRQNRGAIDLVGHIAAAMRRYREHVPNPGRIGGADRLNIAPIDPMVQDYRRFIDSLSRYPDWLPVVARYFAQPRQNQKGGDWRKTPDARATQARGERSGGVCGTQLTPVKRR